MTIKKFQGKTKEEAIEAAKKELGDQVVIMNVKEVKPSGVFGVFKKSSYEITAAIEDEIRPKPSFSEISKSVAAAEGNNFDVVADEEVVIPSDIGQETNQDVNGSELKEAFRAVGEIIGQGEMPKTEMKTYDRNANVIKSGEVSQAVPIARPIEKPVIKEVASVIEPEVKQETKSRTVDAKESMGFVKMLYKVLLDNGVEERYVNQLLDDMEKVLHSGNSLDYMLSNVYQKMVLKMGQPKTITCKGKKPYVVFFIGPTGVGKTTTIAKLASKYKLEYGKKVALVTSDTYRIAAAEQLRTYANILDLPLHIVYSPNEINDTIEKVKDYDLVLVDTTGFSHKNQTQKEDIKTMLDSVDEKFERDVYLVLSATTKYQDLKDIIDTYHSFTNFNLIFTKLDETITYGNILNAKLYSNAELSYITDGQNVPDDIAEFDTQRMVKQLLGGR